MEYSSMVSTGHVWKFFRAGGFDQVLLEDGQDLLSVPELDQKLWVALSCPVGGIEFDRRTLELIDSDHDGHIRVPEIIDAISWLSKVLKDMAFAVRKESGVPLAAITLDTEEGRRIHASAGTILSNLGKGADERISLEEVMDSERIFAQTRFNGDGVVTPASAEDEILAGWISALVELCGGVPDRSGACGVNLELSNVFQLMWRHGLNGVPG